MNWFLFIAALYTLNPITVSIYPAVQHGTPSATVRFTILVPRHAGNRQVEYCVDGPERKCSAFTLDGNAARKSWTVYWTLRGVGTYEARAVLTRIEDGRERQFVDSQPFQIIGPDF